MPVLREYRIARKQVDRPITTRRQHFLSKTACGFRYITRPLARRKCQVSQRTLVGHCTLAANSRYERWAWGYLEHHPPIDLVPSRRFAGLLGSVVQILGRSSASWALDKRSACALCRCSPRRGVATPWPSRDPRCRRKVVLTRLAKMQAVIGN
jgi:hypothetical protein